MRRHEGSCRFAALIAGLAPLPAAAQSTLDTRAEPQPEPTEIIVTATRRSESLQDVPISVTALSESDLTRMGADRFEDYVRAVPGLQYNQNGANSGTFTIRGINTSTLAGNTQSPVAVYYDEIPTLETFAPLLTPDIRLFDVERVEVLRGPQGTLFGSGALGGAIRIITNKPRLNKTEGRGEATIAFNEAGDPSYALSAAINAPLVRDRLALRAVGYYRRDGGYVDNVRTGKEDTNQQDSFGGRIAFGWEPVKALRITASVSHQDDRPDDASFTFNSGKDWKYDSYVPQAARQRLTIYNLLADYDLGGARVVSSTTLADRAGLVTRDFSPVIFEALGELGIAAPTPYTVNDASESFAQEIRLSSDGEGRFGWLLGAFYLNNERLLEERAVTLGAGELLAPLGFPSDTIFSGNSHIRSKELALFGELSYRFTDKLTALAGLRLFENILKFRVDADGLLNGGPSVTRRDTKGSSVSPRFALRYEPSTDLTFYAQAARGYRVGQVNLGPQVDPASGETIPSEYESDSLWNYEAGVRARLMDRRLKISVAVFRIDWSDIQLQASSAAGFQYIDNAGEARSNGVELEAAFRPGYGLELGISAAYTDAQLTFVSPQVNALKGDRLPAAPKFSSSEYLQLETDVVRRPTYFRVEHSFSGLAFSGLNNPNALTYGDYHLFRARVGTSIGSTEIVAFVDNITNSSARTNAIRLPLGPTAVRLRPRTFGLTLRSAF